MPRLDTSGKKEALAVPDTVNMTIEERIELIARLITERIAEDEAEGFPLLAELEGMYGQTAA